MASEIYTIAVLNGSLSNIFFAESGKTIQLEQKSVLKLNIGC